MVIGALEDGRKCVYDLPTEIKTAEQFKNLIYDGLQELPHLHR